jgi:hypothetical protein
MNIPVLIQPLGPQRFRATIFDLSAEGSTADEAKQRVQDELNARLKAGGRVEAIRIPVPDSDSEPSSSSAGILKDHPLLSEWLEIMAENRRREDPDRDY